MNFVSVYSHSKNLEEICRPGQIGDGDIIVGFILRSLKFQSFRIGPIYGQNQDEIYDIVELTKFKVKEHKFKNENPNLKKGLVLKKTY